MGRIVTGPPSKVEEAVAKYGILVLVVLLLLSYLYKQTAFYMIKEVRSSSNASESIAFLEKHPNNKHAEEACDSLLNNLSIRPSYYIKSDGSVFSNLSYFHEIKIRLEGTIAEPRIDSLIFSRAQAEYDRAVLEGTHEGWVLYYSIVPTGYQPE